MPLVIKQTRSRCGLPDCWLSSDPARSEEVLIQEGAKWFFKDDDVEGIDDFCLGISVTSVWGYQ